LRLSVTLQKLAHHSFSLAHIWEAHSLVEICMMPW